MQELLNARDLPAELEDLVRQYGDACWADAHWLRRHTSYGGTYWENAMRAQEASLGASGPLQASLDLIRKGRGTPQSGYLKLLEMGHIERSVEYLVLRVKWRPIFVYFPDVMDTARAILLRSGVTPADQESR